MRDFLPAEKAIREHALGVIRSTFAAQGFDEIETPVMEDAARLHSGLGGDNEKLAFAVMKRGLGSADAAAAAESGDLLSLADLGLRFDLTVPLARFYATHRASLPTVFRAIQIAPVWRAERPQKGRFRQFMQCDIDIIGEPTALAEIELITATTAALDALGLTGTSVRINDRRILTALLRYWGVPAEQSERALITLDKLDKIGVDGVVDELATLGIDTSGVGGTLRAIADAGWNLLDGDADATGGDASALDGDADALEGDADARYGGADARDGRAADLNGDPEARDGAAEAPAWLDQDTYRELLTLRAALPGVDLVFDPTLVRGMGYYTGTIFEIAHPDLPYSLGGGGRYDGMIGRFLGTEVPACGFSIGFERIVELLAAESAADENAVVLIHEKNADPAGLVALKGELVASGKRVRLERRTKNLKPVLERAAEARFGSFAFVGPDSTDAASLDFRPLTS
jgi:histidyl-tRNA synthetase